MRNYSVFLMISALLLSGHVVAQRPGDLGSESRQSIAANGTAAAPDLSAHANVAPPSGYVIGPSDVLTITTWKEPELSETTPVRPDGKIALPLIGEIQAAGLTADRLKDGIAAKLTDYIEKPEVNVVIHEIHSQSFNMLGKVVRPGSYPIEKPTTVLDAIAGAGGFQDFAKVKKIYILRRDSAGAETMLPFNYKRVIKGQAVTSNLQLRPGDTVVVP